jgi:hypothetical protein
MEIGDLDRDERRALVAIVEFMGTTNREVTDEESVEIGRIVEAFGADHYREIAAEVDAMVADEAGLRDLLRAVVRGEARELIYGAALQVAATDTIQRVESELLAWLSREWGLQVRFATPRSAK